MNKRIIIVTLVSILVIAPTAVLADQHMRDQQDSQGGMDGSVGSYQASHVGFDAKQNSVVNFSVGGQQIFESFSVVAKSDTETQSGGTIGVGVGLGEVTNIAKSAMSMRSQTDKNAVLETESGADIKIHNNDRGIITVTPSENSQIANINISPNTRATTETDKKVVITKEDNSEGVFLIVGDGEVTVNNNRNVIADIEQNRKLVYRDYKQQRSDDDRQQENLISNQNATAEVYIEQTDNQYRSNIVQYGDTTVETTDQRQGQINLSVDRTQNQGKIILTTISNQAINPTNNISVQIDGETITQVETYNQLQSSIQQDNPSFLINQQSSTQSVSDIAIAIDHFSTRQITIQEKEDTQQQDDDSQQTDDTQQDEQQQPGFGVIAGLIAILTTTIYILKRQKQ